MNTDNDYKVWIAICIMATVVVSTAIGGMIFRDASDGLCKEIAMKQKYAVSEVIAICGRGDKNE